MYLRVEIAQKKGFSVVSCNKQDEKFTKLVVSVYN